MCIRDSPKKGEVLVGVCGTARMRPPLLSDGPRAPPKWDIPIRVAVRTVAVPNAVTAKVGVKVAVGRGRTTISWNGFRRPNSPRTSIVHDFSTHPRFPSPDSPILGTRISVSYTH